MKNSIKTAVLGLAALVSGFSACNDADYDTLGVHAFVSESASNKSTKVTITELGADAEITACLSEAATKDVKLKFVSIPRCWTVTTRSRLRVFSYCPKRFTRWTPK